MARNSQPCISKGECLFALLCFPCILVYMATDSPARHRHSASNRGQDPEEIKQVKDYAPVPLKPRKRDLSLPPANTAKSTTRKQKAAPQEECTLLTKLPWEVRQMVWEKVLGGETFHIIRMKTILSHVRCTMTDEVRGEAVHHRCWGFYTRPLMSGRTATPGPYHGPRTGFSSHAGGLLPLLKTCRQM